MSVKYNLVGSGDTQNITVFVDGELFTADESHPNFDKIVEGARKGDKSITSLFDVLKTVKAKLVPLSERIAVYSGTVYFDGTPVHDALADQIARFVEDGADFAPLVKFWEKLATNPDKHSREQLYKWLTAEKFTITDDGDILGYKGLTADYKSVHKGPGIVNDVPSDGAGGLDNSVGNVVTIDRSKVVHDPRSSCAFGLHVGTWGYASTFHSGGKVVEVLVNPRDVVSVPTDAGGQKMRVSRYTVLADAQSKRTGAVVDVTKATKVGPTDTRKNFLSQKRDSSGRFVSR